MRDQGAVRTGLQMALHQACTQKTVPTGIKAWQTAPTEWPQAMRAHHGERRGPATGKYGSPYSFLACILAAR